MTNLREAAQMALTAITQSCDPKMGYRRNELFLQPKPHIEIYQETIEALRAALAQPEQEPTAYLCENAVGHKYFRWKKPSSEYKPIALYTAHASPQRIWQGLTDEEIKKARQEGFYLGYMCKYDMLTFAHAIEAKLKEKNGF